MSNSGRRSRIAGAAFRFISSIKFEMTEYQKSSIFNCQSTIFFSQGFQPEKSDRSGIPLKAEGHLFAFDDQRNLPDAF
jgi:hypothetical protein